MIIEETNRAKKICFVCSYERLTNLTLLKRSIRGTDYAIRVCDDCKDGLEKLL